MQESAGRRSGLTAYHAAYLAYELTKRPASDDLARLTGALADAQGDLNPHQVDAALFAIRNPLAQGVILADEVGLGKTIEAGLLLSQRWAERKRRLLVIVPANLRKQWAQELADKFHLPSAILETKTFNASVKSGNLNPFEQSSVRVQAPLAGLGGKARRSDAGLHGRRRGNVRLRQQRSRRYSSPS